ncbi:hypothetical protein MMC09_006017 [Bachmanniomyces sp. S44760]|nr:hypothetical protein [Bachmanniomyces sp. S44760]
MTSSLHMLPPEILSRIISFIDKGGNILDLALCDHALHDILIPFIYRRVQLLHHGYSKGFYHLGSFTIQVLKNPAIASCVRDFTLPRRWASEDDPIEEPREQAIPPDVVNAIRKLSDSSGKAQEWIDRMKAGDVEEAYVAALLPSLPNLNCLDIVIPALHEATDSRFACMLDNAIERCVSIGTAETTPLSNLEVMVANCDDWKYGTSLKLLTTVIQLPRLRKFYGQRIGSDDSTPNERLAKLPSASVHLQHLEIRQSKLNEADLTHLLRIPTVLITFIYVTGFAHISYCTSDTSDIVAALQPVRKTLENLLLDYEPGRSYFTDEDLNTASLINFTSLKNMKVGMYVLFGAAHGSRYHDTTGGLDNTEIDPDDQRCCKVDLASVLPPALETLYISHTNGRISILTTALSHLLSQMQLGNCTQKLRRIAFECYMSGNPESSKFNFELLDELAGKCGVEIRRIDGAAVVSKNGSGWEYTEGIQDRGQGWDGSVDWAAEESEDEDSNCPVYVGVGSL